MENINSQSDADAGDGRCFGIGYHSTNLPVSAPADGNEQSDACFVANSTTGISSSDTLGATGMEPLASHDESKRTDKAAAAAAAAAAFDTEGNYDAEIVMSLSHHDEADEHEQQQQSERLAIGKARAMAALARIRHPPPPSAVLTSGSVPSSECLEKIDNSVAEKRRVGFLRENERKRLAIQKNLEYLAAKDQQKIVLLDQQANQVAALEAEAKLQYQHHLKERESRLKGASTKSKSKPRSTTTLTIYMSGIVVNSSDCDEAVIRKLFGVFGSIRKVHFYRDRKTEALKGDGLVVYDVARGETAAPLVETICCQLDGAELPGGSILHVEPAQEGGSNELGKKPETAVAQQELAASTSVNDLDAFFDSL